MMITTGKVIRCLGALVLLFTPALRAVGPPADTGPASDLSRVRALAEQGSIRDEIVLAGDYFSGDGVERDPKMAAYWYEKAAGNGSPEAQNQIGYFYQAGIGVARDSKRAFHWYQLASSGGLSRAKVNLAIAYLHGSGVQKNDDMAVRLFTQAFQQGNGTAATYIGLLYFFGIAVKEDKVAAEKWFESGLKLHDPLAAYNLGSLYSVHADHPHDLPKAAELLRVAADAGYVPAMHSLGLLMVNHPEVKQTPEQVLNLLETAANAGSWKSSVVLGILARDGRGVPMDKEAAYLHFRIAILQGKKDAELMIKRDLDILGGVIGPERSQAANSAANAWFEHHSIALAYVYKDGATKHDFPPAAMAIAPDGSSAGQLLPLSSSL
jgi:hypothetical protein